MFVYLYVIFFITKKKKKVLLKALDPSEYELVPDNMRVLFRSVHMNMARAYFVRLLFV